MPTLGGELMLTVEEIYRASHTPRSIGRLFLLMGVFWWGMALASPWPIPPAVLATIATALGSALVVFTSRTMIRIRLLLSNR